jgi:hypothetical protein
MLWTVVFGLWWGICASLGMSPFGFVLATVWLITVTVVRRTVGTMAAFVVSIAAGAAGAVAVFAVRPMTAPQWRLWYCSYWAAIAIAVWLIVEAAYYVPDPDRQRHAGVNDG